MTYLVTNGVEESVLLVRCPLLFRGLCMQEWYVYILGLGKGVLFRGVLISVMYVWI